MATILIVDDEEPIRELLASALGKVGYRTLLASHGGRHWTSSRATDPI